MKTIQRSIPIILQQDVDLKSTVTAFTHIKRQISAACFNNGKPVSALSLHKKMYSTVVGKINSQMTCTAIRLVAGAYSAAKRNGHKTAKPFAFNKQSALFLVGKRGRDASFRRDGSLSIWTINGRKRIAWRIADRFIGTFQSAVSIDSLVATIDDDKIMGHLAITIEVPDTKSIHPVGVDLNQTNAVVAVDADDNVHFNTGLSTRILNIRTAKTVSRLQAKFASRKADGRNTRSVVRALKRLGKKRSRRNLDFCRCAAKKLCEWAGDDSVLVLEDLKFKQQKKFDGKRKSTHRKLSGWPYGLMRRCISDKAEVLGIGVDFVNPYNTSKICSSCGLIGERNRHQFVCPHCGSYEHADVNAAVNIRNRYTVLRSSGLPSISPEAS